MNTNPIVEKAACNCSSWGQLAKSEDVKTPAKSITGIVDILYSVRQLYVYNSIDFMMRIKKYAYNIATVQFE